jgi:hypothetical protein
VYSLPYHQKVDFAIEQLSAYFELKRLDEYPHKIENLLGDQDEQFKNGKWNDNWIKQLNAYKTKNNAGTKQIKSDNRSNYTPAAGKDFGKL